MVVLILTVAHKPKKKAVTLLQLILYRLVLRLEKYTYTFFSQMVYHYRVRKKKTDSKKMGQFNNSNAFVIIVYLTDKYPC